MPAPGYVYFIEWLEGADRQMVKVGYTGDPDKRLAFLKTCIPFDLTLHRAYRGTLDDERAVHRRLKKLHIKREWFLYNEDMDEFLADMADAWLHFRLSRGGDYDATIRECMAYDRAITRALRAQDKIYGPDAVNVPWPQLDARGRLIPQQVNIGE